MPRLLALEWDSREARVVVAATRGDSILVEDAFVIALPTRGEESTGDDRATGDVIAAELQKRRVGKAQGLVAVGRASIELKQLSLPPAPDEELPDLVRFQSLREFNTLAEDWPLDYVPLGTSTDGPRQVLAAAISPELVAQIRETCQRARIEPERLVLRPCAAASLLRRARGEEGERVVLLVDVLADEADLTVLVEGQVAFLRTARLPTGGASGPDEHKPLLGEIRRTLTAAQNQLGGRKVEAIELCGSGLDHAELTAAVGSVTSLPTRLFDPFAGLTLSAQLKRDLPQNTGRFAPLLGMLLDEASQARHTIDFLNPRRRPPPPSRRRTFALSAVAASLLLAAGGWWIVSELADLDNQIQDLTAKSKSLDATVEKAKAIDLSAKEIASWTASDVNWLDELRELASDLPQAQEVLLTRLSMGPSPAGGQIDLEGLLRDAATAATLEAGLRDESHHVHGRGLQQDSSRPGYAWKFASSVTVAQQDPEAYRKRGKEVDPASIPSGRGGGGFGTGAGGFQGGFGDGGFGGLQGGFGDGGFGGGNFGGGNFGGGGGGGRSGRGGRRGGGRGGDEQAPPVAQPDAAPQDTQGAAESSPSAPETVSDQKPAAAEPATAPTEEAQP